MTDNNTRQLSTSVILNGHNIPVLGWQCHLTSYGNLCTFEVTTSIKQLKSINYDIFKDQQDTPEMECKIVLSDSTNGQSQIVFDGIVDTIEGVWEHDEIEICGRDYSAVLRDQTATLDTYINQTVSQVVQGICSDNNISADIQTTDQIAGIRASTFQGEDWALSKSPRPLWHIIQELADEVDCVAYVDQFKVLHFVSPGKGSASHQYYWRPMQSESNISQDPILQLSIMQQSRRCNNFTLRLHGYDSNGKVTIFDDVVVGTGEGRLVVKNRQDLTTQNYQQIAQSLADEIQRKNLVVKMVVEGNTGLNINDQVQVLEVEKNDLLGLSNRQLFIVSLVHSFSMPDYGSAEGDGFLSHITCNQMTSTSTS